MVSAIYPPMSKHSVFCAAKIRPVFAALYQNVGR